MANTMANTMANPMIITKHICFYYIEERVDYINKIIDETNKYQYKTDIYLHTNNTDLLIDRFNTYTNGTFQIIYHDLTNIDPFKLTWVCRDLLLTQKDSYDVFMYIEDDILVPVDALNYWIKYNKSLLEKSYNLGFMRIELFNNEEYSTDLYGEKIDTIINIDNEKYCVNNKNPYCAFWIYNKNEFNRFVNSPYYNICNIHGYGTRESSAIGLHGKHTPWYAATVIPIVDNKLIDACRIYHLPNNYVNTNSLHGTIKFKEALLC